MLEKGIERIKTKSENKLWQFAYMAINIACFLNDVIDHSLKCLFVGDNREKP